MGWVEWRPKSCSVSYTSDKLDLVYLCSFLRPRFSVVGMAIKGVEVGVGVLSSIRNRSRCKVICQEQGVGVGVGAGVRVGVGVMSPVRSRGPATHYTFYICFQSM